MKDNGVEAYRRLREIAHKLTPWRKLHQKLSPSKRKEKRDLADEKSPGIVP